MGRPLAAHGAQPDGRFLTHFAHSPAQPELLSRVVLGHSRFAQGLCCPYCKSSHSLPKTTTPDIGLFQRRRWQAEG
jgi:alkylhydroperoxidase family enzyme